MNPPAYVIISPVRNEAEHLPRTIASVAAQTILPKLWILVDDGSSDETARVIDAAAREHAWIRAVHRADRGARRAGSGVMEAFYDGYALVEHEGWDFLVKLDGDLSFAPEYFALCFSMFAADPRLGVGGGQVCVMRRGRCEPEFEDPQFHVRGPTKIYRRACWDELGGLIRAPGWDTYDQVRANMLGWSSRTFRSIPLVHHRPTGGAYGSWSNWTKNGLANYVTGYHPAFMAAKCLRRSLQRPFVVAACGLAYGYVRGWLRGTPQVSDRATIAYLRSQQLACLLGRRSLWSAPPPARTVS